MSRRPTTAALLGKGGAGKTAIAAMAGKLALAQGQRTLFVDADPTMGLTCALGIDTCRTLGSVREEIIARAKRAGAFGAAADLSEATDYLLLEALYEAPAFGLLAMGRSDTLGCYCAVNKLLRSAISAVASQYDLVLIDAEAGIEQINRQVVDHVDWPLIVTDNSLRGVRTALLVAETLKRAPGAPPSAGVIFNRVEEAAAELRAAVEKGGLCYLGTIPPDPLLAERDRLGRSVLELPGDAAALRALEAILSRGVLSQKEVPA
jgi:CO dehydrogenase maturation factor